jgi:hypothetical protein
LGRGTLGNLTEAWQNLIRWALKGIWSIISCVSIYFKTNGFFACKTSMLVFFEEKTTQFSFFQETI